MRRQVLIGWVVMSLVASGSQARSAGTTVAQAPSRAAALAKCLTQNGWVVYTAFTCSACRAQQRQFGDAYKLISRVECHPHAPDSEYARCQEKEIVYTPTWIQEKGGIEIDRLEGVQSLRSLSSRAICPY